MSHENVDYIKILRKKGYRVTSQRLTILDAVCDVGGHATIGQIYGRVKELDPSIDQSTIYRALDILCDVGLIVSAESETEGKVYEIAGPKPHHHLICQNCGDMQTLEHQLVQAFFDVVQQHYAFSPDDEHLILHGICQRCRETRT
ncbi:MAG: transcriptional repressor [Anaerolineae bacterium]|nr:transcriptional repressor [Anaerolineae bacterium]